MKHKIQSQIFRFQVYFFPFMEVLFLICCVIFLIVSYSVADVMSFGQRSCFIVRVGYKDILYLTSYIFQHLKSLSHVAHDVLLPYVPDYSLVYAGHSTQTFERN